MDPNITLGVILIAPVIILMLLRANATLVFLSVCLGYVVMQFLGADALSLTNLFLTQASLSTNIIKLGLLLFPAVFTTLFMIRSVRGSRLVFNVLPAAATGFLLLLLVVPLLTPGTAHAIMASQLWHQIIRLQSLLIGVGTLIGVFFLWLQRPHKAGEDGGKHH